MVYSRILKGEMNNNIIYIMEIIAKSLLAKYHSVLFVWCVHGLCIQGIPTQRNLMIYLFYFILMIYKNEDGTHDNDDKKSLRHCHIIYDFFFMMMFSFFFAIIFLLFLLLCSVLCVINSYDGIMEHFPFTWMLFYNTCAKKDNWKDLQLILLSFHKIYDAENLWLI